MSGETLKGRPFVVYQFRGSGAFPWIYAVHPAPGWLGLKVGERVLLNVKDCAGMPQRVPEELQQPAAGRT